MLAELPLLRLLAGLGDKEAERSIAATVRVPLRGEEGCNGAPQLSDAIAAEYGLDRALPRCTGLVLRGNRHHHTPPVAAMMASRVPVLAPERHAHRAIRSADTMSSVLPSEALYETCPAAVTISR